MCTTMILGVRAPTVVHYSGVTLALCVKKYLVLLNIFKLYSGHDCGMVTE